MRGLGPLSNNIQLGQINLLSLVSNISQISEVLAIAYLRLIWGLPISWAVQHARQRPLAEVDD